MRIVDTDGSNSISLQEWNRGWARGEFRIESNPTPSVDVGNVGAAATSKHELAQYVVHIMADVDDSGFGGGAHHEVRTTTKRFLGIKSGLNSLGGGRKGKKKNLRPRAAAVLLATSPVR